MNNQLPADKAFEDWLNWLYDDRASPVGAGVSCFDVLFDADFTAWMHSRGYSLTRDVMTLEAMQRRYIADARRRLAWADA